MVRLVPMTETEFQAYLEQDIERYAQERVRAGDWHTSEALQKSREEHQVKDLGIDKIALRVFAHNRGARALYEKTGFAITGIYMTKKLTR